MERDNALSVVQKLIAHEASVRTIGNIEEAENYAEKIQRMLFEYRFTLGEVCPTVKEPELEPLEEERLEGELQRRVRAGGILAGAVADMTCCVHLVHPGSDTISFVGTLQNRTDAKLIFENLYSLCEELASKALIEWKAKTSLRDQVKQHLVTDPFGSSLYERIRSEHSVNLKLLYQKDLNDYFNRYTYSGFQSVAERAFKTFNDWWLDKREFTYLTQIDGVTARLSSATSRTWKRSCMIGFAEKIAARVRATKATLIKEEEAKAEFSSGEAVVVCTALTLYHKEAARLREYRETLGTAASLQDSHSKTGFARGSELANDVCLEAKGRL